MSPLRLAAHHLGGVGVGRSREPGSQTSNDLNLLSGRKADRRHIENDVRPRGNAEVSTRDDGVCDDFVVSNTSGSPYSLTSLMRDSENGVAIGSGENSAVDSLASSRKRNGRTNRD